MIRLDALVKKYVEKEFGEVLSRTYIQKILESGAVKFNNEVIKRKGFKFKSDKYLDKLEFDKEKIKAIVNEYLTGQEAFSKSDLWNKAVAIGDINISPDDIDNAFDLEPLIVYQDDNYILTYKPPGVLSHPDSRGDPNNMVYAYIKYMRKVYNALPRAGLLHRLDKPTQGLLLFAKNMKAYNHVKKQFMEHQMHKLYLVIHEIPNQVSGIAKHLIRLENKKNKFAEFWDIYAKINQNDGEIAKQVFDYVFSLEGIDLFGYIAQHRSRRFSRFEQTPNRLANKNYLRIKEAKSIIYPLGVLTPRQVASMFNVSETASGFSVANNTPVGIKNAKNSRLLGFLKDKNYGISAVRLLTGRTHQIRTQFKYIGLPVLGDYIYNKTGKKLEMQRGGLYYGARKKAILPEKNLHDLKNEVLSYGFLGLVASGLSFNNLQNKRQYFTLPKGFLRIK